MDPHRGYIVVFVPQFYCTLVPQLWDVCWPTVLQTHGIRLTVVFFHGISPIKENIVTRLCTVLFGIVKNLCDCVGETVRA